jgi:RHS repeat-associated protein
LFSAEYFDGLGRVYQKANQGPDGKTIQSEAAFDSRGLVLAATAPHFSTEAAVTTSFVYDPLGRQTRVNHPDGTFATSAYSVPGTVTLTDERGKTKRKHFDAYGRLIQVDEVNGTETYYTQYAYDAAGSLLTVTNHLGHLTKMAYDTLGRKIAMCDPNMGTAVNIASCTTASVGAWVYTYSPAGDLLTQTDAKNQTLTFTYDSIGRPTLKKQGATTLVQWTYDTTSISPPPTGGDFPIGRLTQVYQPPIDTTTRFAYDAKGRTLQTNRQLLGVWYTMSQTYDTLSRIATETFNDGEIVTYNYNGDWVQSITSSNSPNNYISGIQYNARGQRTDITYGNNLVSHFDYNPNNFRVTARTTSNNLQNLGYLYDNNGNITSIQDNLGGSAGRNFQYDDLNRLTYADGNFGANQAPTSCTYVYDPIGNLTNKCGATFTYGDSMHPSAVTFNPATGKNYSYDANGNMVTRGTQTLTWDADNRVTSISIQGGGTTSMEYDYSGVRLKKNAPTGITLYPFAGVEIDPNGVMTKYIRVGIETLASKKGAQQLFYHNDHLGSVNVISDINGTEVQRNEYDPWGSVSKATGNIDPTHRFTGKELDPETGLYYYGGRYYDPEISRFVSPDPFVPEPGNPQALNRYSYTINNPQRYIDPSGFSFWSSIANFFKNLFRRPAVFFATLLVGIITGGAAYAAAPVLFGAGSLLGSGIGQMAFAGAMGGMFAGMTGAAMTGGNIWQAALLGFVGGGVGGGVFQYMQGGIGAYLAGATAGGAVAGGFSTAFHGGNFFENMLLGGITSLGVASGFAAARFVYEAVVTYEPDWRPGGPAVPKGPQDPPLKCCNNVGEQTLSPASCSACEGSPMSNILNRIFGINATAGFHDKIVTQFAEGSILRSTFGPINIPTMLPAAAISYSAIVATFPFSQTYGLFTRGIGEREQ